MPTRDIDSTPPPMARSFWPATIARRREVHRIEAGGAEAVDLHARHRLAEAGMERRGAGDVAARLADRIDAAQNDVVDRILRQAVALGERAQRMARERQRRHLVQGAVGLAAPARGAHRVVDVGFGHRPRTFMRR